MSKPLVANSEQVLLGYEDLRTVYGISYHRNHLRRLMRKTDGDRPPFPRPVRIGARRIAWKQAEVRAWLAECERLTRG
jgi:predicted DNA-binding transcriptional regulator AlpA